MFPRDRFISISNFSKILNEILNNSVFHYLQNDFYHRKKLNQTLLILLFYLDDFLIRVI